MYFTAGDTGHADGGRPRGERGWDRRDFHFQIQTSRSVSPPSASVWTAATRGWAEWGRLSYETRLYIKHDFSSINLVEPCNRVKEFMLH